MIKYLKYGLIFIFLLVIGVAIYYRNAHSVHQEATIKSSPTYTCPMHPEIIRETPGNCPICGMTLVEIVTENHEIDNQSIDNLLLPTDQFIVGKYLTTAAKDTTMSKVIPLSGTVAFDPNSAVNIASRISGRIEKMYVNYTYQKISKGQKLFDLYSPELLTAQQNFIYLIDHDADNVSIIQASKLKLLLYGMTENQVNLLERSKTVNPQISIYSPIEGIIIGSSTMYEPSVAAMSSTNTTAVLNVKEGSYITKGDVVFRLMNLDTVWGIFNVPASNSSQIKLKLIISITTEINETEVIQTSIDFVETQLDPTDKSNQIRVYMNNSQLKLPIGTRLHGLVHATPIQGIWIPKHAMVSIGTKKVVFVKFENGFKAVDVHSGIEMNDFVQILDGISVDVIIAQNAQYLMDSESFIKTESL